MKRTSIMTSTLCLVVILSFYFNIGTPNVVSANETLSLHSETAILMDAETGEILFNQKMEQTMYPASITKIVTAIVAIEEGNLADIVTVSSEAVNVTGTRVYLLEDERVPLLKLVQGLLISSGNDAGTAIAEHMSGSEEQFSELMNTFVKEKIGIHQTHFTNPHGLYDENHLTTAYDMAKITQYAMQNEMFREIVGTKEMEWIGEGWETVIYNHNRLLWNYEGATGVKNGFVRKSGYTLVTTAKRDEMELIAVTLNAPSADHAYNDMKALFDYGFDHYHTNVIFSNNVFQSEKGERYVLDEDLYFLSNRNEEISIRVNSLGRLWVRGEGDRIIETVRLKPEESPKETVTMMEDIEEVKEASQSFLDKLLSHFQSILSIFSV
ncbi:D-alanyl-D-alanine carboxypeptidase [Alkalihalobacillus sp. MEB130]|uniref:D-alanyl-D-alanine carboxypeptidase family protein n=1 Tax=Alkalihalobacillus sp. MEB130 TaxID=2976704 RepID=UPI0028DE6D39|nr:D-alanyl-D-alanine carboxypeptidase family protein [Alkalihalobacillus sp. MEB130]MDT8859634.1 D-alanyl-D-alanine carboxypeptidase [Alkalihalobacillus sp. MEB130]